MRSPAPSAQSAQGEQALGLVEREYELVTLCEALDGAVAAEGSVVTISGPPGIGKSSLLGEVRRAAATRGVPVLVARGTQQEQSFTFGVIRALLELRLRRMDDDTRARLFTGAASSAAVALGMDDSTGMVEVSTPLLNAIYWVIADLCELEPVVIIVDDAQWADAPSLRALAFLAQRIEALPLTLLVAIREGEACDEPAALETLRAGSVQLEPRLLSREAVGAIIAAKSDRPLAESELLAVHHATGGNPLWAAQAARVLADRRLAEDLGDDTSWSTAALSGVVVGRLRRMPADARAVALAIAVLGDGAPHRHVADLAGVPREALAATGTALVAAGLLEDTPELALSHALIREGILRGEGALAVSAAHARAADLLRGADAPIEQIAAHVLKSVGNADPQNVTDLVGAAFDALRRGSPVSALTYVERAVAEPAPEAMRPDLDILRGFAEFRLARFAEAAEHLSDAAGMMKADTDVVVAHGTSLAYTGRGDEHFVRLTLAAVARQEDPDHQLLLSGIAAVGSWYLVHRWEPAVALPPAAELAGRTVGERVSLAAHALHHSNVGSLDTAADLAELALGDGQMLAERPSLVLTSLGPLWVLIWSGRLDAFDREARHLEALSRSTASTEATYMLAMLRLERYLQSGDLPAALAAQEAMRDIIRETPGGENLTVVHLVANTSYWQLLLAHEGAAAADRAMTSFLANSDLTQLSPFYPRWMQASRSLVALAAGRTAEALGFAEEHAAFAASHGGFALPIGWQTALPLARLAVGDNAGAREAAEAFVARERLRAVPARIAVALRVLARVDPVNAVGLLTESLRLHAGGSMRIERATTLLELGIAQRRTGSRPAAREALEQAASLATECHAMVLAERARDELKILGAKPRRASFSGIASLTASERRIADLAAAGLTNREIAQQLYVSLKTVESHLAQVFRKLDIGSRDRLPRRMVERTAADGGSQSIAVM